MKKLLISILFYGALWGIAEATIGHVLHFIPATIAGSIMFPIASLILYRSYKTTNSTMSLIYVGAIAAAIKSVDFLLPQLSIFKTLNPMMAIVTESVVVVIVLRLLRSEQPVKRYLALPVASLAWRSMFLAWMAVQYELTGNLAPYIQTISAMTNFVVISGLISGAIASFLLFVFNQIRFKVPELSKQPVLASLAMVVAILVTYLF